MTPDERKAWMRVTAYLRKNFKGVHMSASLSRVEDGARSYFEYVRTVNRGSIAEAEEAARKFVDMRIAELKSERGGDGA